MSKKYILLGLLPFFFSCDHIDEADRLIKVEVTVNSNVLLEDFTGQRCVNCPKGTEVIEQLHKTYGDRIIAVGIHGGPLGFSGNATNIGLATPEGDEYYNHWKLEYQPVGLVNRGGISNYTDWTKDVSTALAHTTGLQMEVKAERNGDNIDITVNEVMMDGNYSGKLQVWLLEDSITALQLMPDGSANREYVHNHVLRTPVNGTWGEDFTIAEGEQKEQAMTQKIDAAWKADNLSIVAFIYNDNGVEQVVKAKVTTATDSNDETE